MDLSAIQGANRFMADQMDIQKRRQKEFARVNQRTNQAETQLKQEALYIKALEQVKEKSDKEITRDREKKRNEHNTELWMQRFGRNEWNVFR